MYEDIQSNIEISYNEHLTCFKTKNHHGSKLYILKGQMLQNSKYCIWLFHSNNKKEVKHVILQYLFTELYKL